MDPVAERQVWDLAYQAQVVRVVERRGSRFAAAPPSLTELQLSTVNWSPRLSEYREQPGQLPRW